MVSTLDFESSDPSSNLGGTSEAFLLLYFIFNLKSRRYVHTFFGKLDPVILWRYHPTLKLAGIPHLYFDRESNI